MKELVLQVNGQIGSLLYGMCISKEWTKNLFVSSEQNFNYSVQNLTPLIKAGYISVTRKGRKASLNILSKGREEIIKWD